MADSLDQTNKMAWMLTVGRIAGVNEQRRAEENPRPTRKLDVVTSVELMLRLPAHEDSHATAQAVRIVSALELNVAVHIRVGDLS